MREVGVLEAKTQLSALIAEVETSGEPIGITRHGRRVVRLMPESAGAVTPPRSEQEWRRVIEDTWRWADELAAANPKLAEPFDLRAERDSLE